jgi:6-pyruvoyltetrahydropterin/6-carboxytetrahydropterin synthase
MSSEYIVKFKTEFSAAHALRGYDGDCARIHGHNWKIEAEIRTLELNNLGLSIDFKIVKQHLRSIADIIEHQYLNDIEPFDELNPTAENIVSWFFDKLAPLIAKHNCDLIALTLWETDRASIRYSRT